jgi:hypothetical protein
MGVVANSLLERGEVEGSWSGSCTEESGGCLLSLSASGISVYPGAGVSCSNCSCSSCMACVPTTCGSRSSLMALGLDCILTYSSKVSVSGCLGSCLGQRAFSRLQGVL